MGFINNHKDLFNLVCLPHKNKGDMEANIKKRRINYLKTSWSITNPLKFGRSPKLYVVTISSDNDDDRHRVTDC
jgi:hypothetical protein